MDALLLIFPAAAALRYAIALPAAVRYLRRARVSSIPAGPTPPLSVVLEGPTDPGCLAALHRQNYPDYEVLEDGAAPRHPLVVRASTAVRADPLFLRDAANGLAEADAVFFPAVQFGMDSAPARAAGLFLDVEVFLEAVVRTGAATGEVSARREGGRGGRTRARRAARCVFRPRCWRAARRESAGRVARVWRGAPAGALLAALASPAPIALAVLSAWWLLALAAVQTAIAAAVDLRFCWDRSLLRALPWLPLVWLLAPLLWIHGARASFRACD